MIHTFVLQPRDPILIRDGRPFAGDPGARARSLEWPLPSTIAGAIRTRIGDDSGFDWSAEGPSRAKAIALHGALPLARSCGEPQVFVARPSDYIAYEDGDEKGMMCLRPDDGAASFVGELPEGVLPMKITEDVKPTKMEALWSMDSTVKWLSEPAPTKFEPHSLAAPEIDGRIHVSIDRSTGAAREGMLFSTEMRVLPDAAFTRESSDRKVQRTVSALGLLCRIESDESWRPATCFTTLGGERRVAYIEPSADAVWPSAGDYPGLVDALDGTMRIRLQIVTPALFADGWRPGWIDETGTGELPNLDGVRLRLVGAAVGRPMPVSGWDLTANKPKPARYAVAAGSVFFFEVVGGEVTDEWVRRAFLAPVSDARQDRADGFGLVLPGVW